MKILFLLRIEVIPTLAGVERVTHVLTQFFLKKGIDVSYLYYGINSITDNEAHNDVNVFFLPNSEIYKENENIAFINKLLIDNKIDIIINQSAVGNKFSKILAKSIKNTPTNVISVLHSTPITFEQYKLQFNEELLSQKVDLKLILKKFFHTFFSHLYYLRYSKQLRLTYNFSAVVLLLSDRFIPLFSNLIKIKHPNKLKSIPNPLSFNSEYNQNDISEKHNTVLYVGRLEYLAKRIDRLIQAWNLIEKRNTDWQLVIVGGDGGNPKEKEQIAEFLRLNNLVSDLNLINVKFVGRQNPLQYYENSKIFCMTSSNEGFPMVLGEAMQHGVVPVVFGSYESVYDIIDSKINGIIVKPFDIEEYAKEMEQLMLNSTILAEMARQAIEKSKQFEIEIVGNKWLSLFNELCSK